MSLAPLTYGSVCSGIEAASVAWHPLGWRAAFLSEIEAFPRAVLAHHYPAVPLHGDFTTIEAGQYDPIDLLVGGTPCQSFSVAGLRGGLADGRGNLALEYLRLADRLRPQWLVWENVPGVLSSNGGRDFGAILGGMVELGYGFAYRVLDAQHFGVPQRRRRVFVVGYLGDWRPAAAVLFERHSLQGHPAPRRKAGEGIAGALAGVSPGGGWRVGADEAAAGQLVANPLRAQAQPSHREDSDTYIAATIEAAAGKSRGAGTPIGMLAFGGNDTRGPIEVACALNASSTASGRMDFESETFIATTLRARDGAKGVDSDCTDTLVTHSLTANGFDASEDGTGRGTPLVPVAYAPEVTATMAARSSRGSGQTNSPGHNADQQIVVTSGVRRLTPRECERLQGFRDDFTAIEWWRWSEPKAVKRNHRVAVRSSRTWGTAADGPRYKALGNSMAVPVMAWIGRRIDMVRRLHTAAPGAAS